MARWSVRARERVSGIRLPLENRVSSRAQNCVSDAVLGKLARTERGPLFPIGGPVVLTEASESLLSQWNTRFPDRATGEPGYTATKEIVWTRM